MNTEQTIPPPYEHQSATTNFILSQPRCLITSDPGTGKTRAVLDAHINFSGKTLVLAPLSILEAAWAEDIYKFQPDIKFGVAYAKNRKKIFEDGAFEMVILISKLSTFYVKIHITLTGFLQSLLMSLLLSRTNSHSAVKMLENLSHVLLIGLPCLVLLTVILF